LKFFRAVQEFLGFRETEVRAHAVPARGGGVSGFPLCFILDASGGAHAAKLLHSHNVQTKVFSALGELAQALGNFSPTIIILGAIDMQQLRGALESLAGVGFNGSIQPVLDNPRPRGSRALAGPAQAMRILPAVQSPISAKSIDALIKSEGLALTQYDTPEIDLDVALVNNWIEFWYQPRIDLKSRMLIGAECIARLRHPIHGVLKRTSFLPNASESGLRILGRNAIRAAVTDWRLFLKMGHNIPIATYLPRAMWDGGHMMSALRRYHPGMSEWPGMSFDIDCAELEAGFPLEAYADKLMEYHGVRIGLNEFRSSPRTLAALQDFPFSKLKLPRNVVQGISDDPEKQRLCRETIDLAHSSGTRVAAIGVEGRDDIRFLMAAGCDIAQGGLFSPPLPSAEFVALLRTRTRGVSAYPDAADEKSAR
jgi:EAL domain-containing protein (putative c-di-GMP-specific phosphodiesterase class I)